MESPSAHPHLELHVTAAKLVLGLMRSWELPPVADRALSNGEYSPALAELAAIKNPAMSDAEPLFIKALAELGLQMPSRADSAWLIVRHCMEQIASDCPSPRHLLSLIERASNAAVDVIPHKKFVGDGLDLGSLIGIHWSYSAPNENCYEGRVITDETERQAILDSLAQDEARAWLQRHAGTKVAIGPVDD